jgi:integrase
MRHSAISWWANSGIPLAAVRDRAGHSNISVTSRYRHVMPGDADPFAAFLGQAA